MNTNKFQYLRPEKQKLSTEFNDALKDISEELHVKNYSNCTLYPHYCLLDDTIKRTCITLSEAVAGESGAFLSMDSPDKDVPVYEGVTLYGGYYRPIWGHFLVNTMERLWYYFSSDCPPIDRIVFVSDNQHNCNTGGGNIARFNQLAGLSSKFEIINRPHRFEQLIVPDQALTHLTFSHQFLQVFDVVKNAVKPNKKVIEYPERVFLTRSRLKNARKNEINCEILDEFFKKNGFTVLSPEKMTLDDLILYFRHAKYIVSICGTLAHNFLFAPNNAKFAIIERHAFINEWQMSIDRAMGTIPDYIDTFELPLHSDGIGSLFLYQATEMFNRWVKDEGFLGHSFKQDEKSRKKELKRFVKRYFTLFGYAPYYNSYDVKLGRVYVEANLEANKIYGKWLRRTAPLFFWDYFRLKCHPKLRGKISKIVKRILKTMK